MTTAHSPAHLLKRQADKIAAVLKAAERGDKLDVQFAQKIEEARQRGTFKAGIVMDDKVLTLDLPWSLVREASEPDLSAYIVEQMQRPPHVQ